MDNINAMFCMKHFNETVRKRVLDGLLQERQPKMKTAGRNRDAVRNREAVRILDRNRNIPYNKFDKEQNVLKIS